MPTEFDDSQHYATFKGAGAMRTGNAFDVRWSEVTLAALRAAGVLDNMVDGLSPPATDKLWLDKNSDPAVLKEWDPVGAAWVKVTSQTIFGRLPFRGAWETAPIYRTGDLIFYGTNIWVARLPNQNHEPAEGSFWDVFIDGSNYATASQGAKADTSLQLSSRNRAVGYTPVYDMNGTGGSGTSLAVHNFFDIGDITLPSGADKQYNSFRFVGIFRNGDSFETAGGKAIAFDLQSYNADLYGVIGSVTAKSGTKEVKAVYGRGVLDTADGGVAVGLVGGATVTSAANGATGTAWSLQLTLDGPGTLSTINLQRLIQMSTNETSKTVGYGLYSDQKLGYSTAFARAFNAGAGRFLQWDDYNGGSPINLFEVEKGGRVRSVLGSIGAPSFSFIGDTDTGMYSPGANRLGLSAGGTQAAEFRAPPGDTYSSAILLVNIGGVTSQKSVRFGAANTGPGENGRALYIDN